MNDLAPVLAIVTGVLATAWIIRSILQHRRYQRVVELQARTHEKLIDRFDSSTEMEAFLSGPAGRELVRTVPLERTSPYRKILSSIQTGIIMTLAGVAFLTQRSAFADDWQGFNFLGFLGIFLGTGFLVSAAVGYFLSRRWGLLEDTTDAD